jgi:type I restriction-modification system DNA methylase subunit
MAAETQQSGLTADERSGIRSAILDTRELIEDDLFRQLERYGVYEDERVDLEQLGHLDSYDIETRRKIDAAIDREMEATDGDYRRSVENYVREATKTYLNRLVALKAIEVRGLVTETLMERPEYGNRSEMLRIVDEVAGELTDQQDGGQSAALKLAYTELTDEIGVIFEEREHTAIDLDFAVRERVIEQLKEIDESVWESDEAMGWVYQYFGEKEREEIDDRIDEENYKIQDTDVATKTQLFTPRYIVEWMVDNSLGRLWLEMHGEDTNIDDEGNCFYLAPLEESLIDRDSKDVRDIKVLDPACGSGHMLFYAFDVLYEMYLEEGNIAEKYIPREILKHNLYGIDIDPGAAQLAALSLYVKAKSEEPDVDIEQINIASADAVLVNGEKKEEVLARAETKLEERVLEQVWRSFEHIREWGSLVRIEERIEEIIEEELEELRATGQTKFTEDGLAKQSSVVSFSGEEESWVQVKDRLLSEVSELAEEALERNDPIEKLFVGEVKKSVRLLDLFVGDYDVVVSNPPYLVSGKMEDTLKQFVKDNYRGSRDLYTAFIERCLELANDDNYVAMVTPENFMFLYSYRGLRKELVSNIQIIEGAHLSGHSFPPKSHPFTIPFVVRNRDPGDFKSSRFYRMTHKQEEYAHNQNKISGLKTITGANRREEAHADVYVVDQNSFREIGRTPFIYWFGNELLDLLKENIKLDSVAEVKQGLATGNDDRFVRKWWEVCEKDLKNKYVRYQKSGSERIYYDIPADYLFWENDGKQIRDYDGGNGTPSEQFYFTEGITFRAFGKVFAVRKQFEDTIFSHKAHFVYTEEIEDNLLMGILASSLYRFIMDGLNPGMMFEAGDGKRLPIKTEIENQDIIKNLVSTAVNKQIYNSSLIENSADFESERVISEFKHGLTKILYSEYINNSDVYIIHGTIDRLVFEEYDIPLDTIKTIYEIVPQNLVSYPHITNAGELATEKNEFRSEVQTKDLSENEYQELVSEIDDLKDNDLREISEQLEVSPYTVAMVRHKHDLYTREEKNETAGRLLSYFLGCAMGRWEFEGLNPNDNGIIVFDSDFEDDLMSYMRRCIELTYGDEELYKRETGIEEMLNKSIDHWFRSTFFRYHHCKEYRRRGQRIPIYWQLESDEGAFSCFVYYHKMNADTLPKLRGQYIDKKLDTLRNRLEAIESELKAADGDQARDLRSEKEEIHVDIDDISGFRDRVDALIDEGFEPDFEAGIWENIQKVDEHDLLAVPLDKL